MSYRLKSGEAPSQGLKRIFRQEIQSALQQCRHPAKERGVTVHETRKHLKKLRAALHLAVAGVGKDRHTREGKCLRDIGKMVSELRDAHVRLQTLIHLRDEAVKRGAKNPFSRIEELLSMERESFSAAFGGWQKQAVVKLEATGKRISKWPLDDLTWSQVCGAVAKSYRRGREALATALRKPNARNLHDWRKKVKELLYQLRLLQPLNRVVLNKIATDAKTLGQLLGRGHDFTFLLNRLDREKSDRRLQDEIAELRRLIRKLTRRLQRDVMELGRRFYAEPPKAFAKRISIFVDDWVSKKKRRSK
jgi:CHAD domain-containing protein